jgi:hypothetical protein
MQHERRGEAADSAADDDCLHDATPCSIQL